jgi:hypothetical protein
MKYCKEYLALFLLVVAVVIIGPLISAIHNFSALSGGANNDENKKKHEGFSADRIPSGEYPREVEEPLLYPTYPKKVGPEYGVVIQENNADNNNSKLYAPIAMNVSNYDQATNNVRDWNTPDNGTCNPIGMCGALYTPKATAEHTVPEPLPLDHPSRRVGFYATD